MTAKVSDFRMHDAQGHAVLKRDWLRWVRENEGPGEFGITTHYSWNVGGDHICVPVDISQVTWHELPDGSGFICFDKGFQPDNCRILDTYGLLRCRLRVPWELTGLEVPAETKMWFRNTGTHDDGQFGVTAWIEYAGDFYFELDYHEGRFLWGKEIRF